jgi:hypothetical protein
MKIVSFFGKSQMPHQVQKQLKFPSPSLSPN